jgi:hypothetical protein
MKKADDEDAPKRLAIREQIDENLKRVYAAALNEELPDRFRDLLAQLKAKDGSGNSGSGNTGSGNSGPGGAT